MANISLQEFLGDSTLISTISSKDEEEEEKKRKKAEFEKLLKEESKEEDFISAEEAGIKISPLSDAVKKEDIITQLTKDKDKEKKTITLEEFLGESGIVGSETVDVMEGSVLDGARKIDTEEIIDQHGYYSWENLYENVLKRTFGGAARDTAQATVDTINWAAKKLPGVEEDIINKQFEKVEEPDYFGGSLSRDLLGFGTALFGVGKFAKAANLITKIPKATTWAGHFVRAAVKGENAAQFTWSPYESRITNLIESYPYLANPISEYLAANTEDSENEARFKMALEGSIFAVGIDKLLRLLRPAKKAGIKTNKLKNTDKPIKKFNEKIKREAEIIEDATGVKPKSLEEIDVSPSNELTVKRLSPNVTKKIERFWGDLVEQGLVARNPLVRIGVQIFDTMRNPRIMKIIKEKKLLEKYNISIDDLMDLYRRTKRASAQELNQLSQWAKATGKFMDDAKLTKKDRAALEAQGVDVELLVDDWVKQLDNIRRGMMVGRWATAARNFLSQMGRQGINVLNEAVQWGGEQLWRAATLGKGTIKKPADPIRTFQGFIDIFRQIRYKNFKKIKADVDKIISFYPNLKDRLFLRYSSDVIAFSGKKYSPLGVGMKGVDLFNVFNRFQEFITRRAVFQNALDAIIRKRPDIYGKGMTLARMVADKNLIVKIRPKDIAASIDIALEATYAAAPKSEIGRAFVSFINKMPFVLSLLVPFPRFLVNSLKFLFEYSPLSTARGVAGAALDIPATMLTFSIKGRWTTGFLKRLSKGDLGGMSKAVVGWGIFATAYQIRGSKFAGEKWNEIVVGDKTIDTLPYNPLAAYLYVADLVHRYQNGVPVFPSNPTKELLKVFAGTRGGTGLYMVDQIINLITDPMTHAKWNKVFDLVGKVANQYMTPFKTYINLWEGGKSLFEGDAIKAAKDTRTTPLDTSLGLAIEKNFKSIFNKDELPDYTSTTHAVFDDETNKWVARPLKAEGTTAFGVEIPAPFVTELTGLTIKQPKNAAEKELDRLNFQYREIFQTTGIPFLDRMYKDILAPQIHFGLSTVVTNEKYLTFTPNVQILIIKEFLKEAKKNTMTALQQDESLIPYLMEYKINNLPKTQRKVLDEILGKEYIDTLIKEFQSAK